MAPQGRLTSTETGRLSCTGESDSFAYSRFRFYFFSREERRPHVHVQHAEGEARFWIDPTVELHANYGLKPKRLAEAERLVEEHLDEIRSAWAKHFPD